MSNLQEELISIKTTPDHQYFTLPLEDVKEFIKEFEIDPFEGGMYAGMYMLQCRIYRMAAHRKGLYRYYRMRSKHIGPLTYLLPHDHNKYLVRKYRFDKSSLVIGLIVGRKWADFKISGKPFSWIDIENEIKE